MQAVTTQMRDLVLVGGGHTHALVLRMLAMRPIDGLRITLVSPDSHTPYSGMLPGLIAGHYRFEETHIDLARLCQWAGVRFIATRVIGLNPVTRKLTLNGRPAISYDVLSLDIGSQPELDSVPGAREHAVPVKPVAGLWQRWLDLHERISKRVGGDQTAIAIVGGGAGSVELALAMAHQLREHTVSIDLYCGAAQILQGYNNRARASVVRALAEHGVALRTAARVDQVAAGRLHFSDGSDAAFDELFWCTGAAAAPWIAASGLPVDAHGFLAIRDTLQSTGDDGVFGAGDIATQLKHPRPKAGVFAVRQAPVLAANIRALLLDRPLREHRPQQRFLSLVSLGGRSATADKGPFSATGHWVWRWKDRIDRAFMVQFENLPLAMAARLRDRLPELSAEEEQAICGGCGAKVGADVLAEVLRQLAEAYPDHCQPVADDAAPVPEVEGPVIQSVDVLRAIVADPWQMGRIAANHALSDLFACGAKPLSALAVVTLPYADSRLLRRELEQLLAGALHQLAAVDCVLTGGHTMQGPELALGFVVNGAPLDADQGLLDKRGGVVGDQLVLTRALGTGVLYAAHMQLGLDSRVLQPALRNMLRSNAEAAQLAVSHGASACTDVTGFGLLGHLREMLGEHVGAHLKARSLPLLPGALEQVRGSILSTMHPANKQSAGTALQIERGTDPDREQMLFDPQTSGGLLIAIAPARAKALCEALRAAGDGDTVIIGELVARADSTTPEVVVSP